MPAPFPKGDIMKLIKIIAQKIEEEMRDAEDYAKLAFAWRQENPDVSETFLALSKQEVSHATMLHTQAERLVAAYRSEGNEVPPAMQALYEWEHEKLIDGMARIKVMQDMVR